MGAEIGKRHNGALWENGSVLYLDCGDGYREVCLSECTELHTQNICIYCMQIYLNKIDFF